MRKSSETVHISVMDKDHIVFVGKVESIQGIRSVAALGIRKEAYQTASGKAIIAFMPEQELESHISRINFRTYLPNTITNREELLRDLQSVKQNGYAVDNEEYELGGICVASPIFDDSGRAIAAVSISGPTTRVSLEKAKNEFSVYVKETAVQLSREMGYLNQEYFHELLDKAGW
ncbi:MAG TPA: IclR family transcriptional regulator [Anaerovoracaceae bacterium]|nr:IclR family transcriptional regulator [Anaerovoracaceae bacterium]